MNELFNSFYEFIMSTIEALGVYGPFLGSLFIILESIICTCIGCIISYYLVKKFLRNWIVDKIKNVNLLTKCMHYIENLSLSQVTVILSIPFTPAFMINIAAGLCNMNFKKFVVAILISKIFLVYFWGVVGTSLLDSLHNPTSIITVVVMMIVAYVFSIIIKKVLKID